MTRRDTTGVVWTAICVSLSLTIAILGGVSVAVAPATAATGSVDGGTITECGTIDQPGSYELGDDITAPDTDACLTVGADDVTVDGAGYTVDGVDNDTLSYGVQVTGTDVTVIDLTVSGFAQGVRVEGDGFLGRGLTTTENGVYGVSAFGTNGVALNDSTVTRNGQSGVYTSSAGDTVVARTVVRNHPRFGIYVGGDTGGTVVEDGRVVDTGEAGIYVSGGSGPRIDGTTVEATGDDPNIEAGNGAGVYASAPGTVIDGVTVTGSAGHGVHLVGSAEDTGFTVSGATVTDNAGDGVRVDGTLRASVSMLTARENRDGVNLTDAAKPSVSGAVVEANARHGVSVDGGSGASLNAVQAGGNGAWAVFLSDDPGDVTATGLVLDSATLAFTATDVAVGPGPVPGGERPAGKRTVGAFFNVTTTAGTDSGTGGSLGGMSADGGAAGYLDVDVSYTDAGLGDVDESTLEVSRYDGGNWSTASSTVDTDSNTVSANLTDPAAGVDGGDVFGPLGELEGAVVECTTIDSPGAYVLDTDLGGVSGPCITIASSDVTLDGSGHHVAGDETGSGVLVAGSSTLRNVTVSDLQVSGFARGLSLLGTDGVAVENVNASDNVNVGVGANDSSALTLDGVTASANGREASGGDPLFGTDETEAVDGVGVLLDGVDGATMTDTTAAANRGEDVVLTGGTVADLGPTDVDGTTVSLTDARDVSVSPVESPQSPESGYEAVTGYVNISATSDRASATVTLGYDESAVGDESALVLGKYDESWGYFDGVDTSANTVTAEISSFSQFAVLESQDGGSGSDTPTPTPTPSPTSTPTPTPTSTPTPTPTDDGGNGGSGTTGGGGDGTAPSGGGDGGGSTDSADIVVVDNTLNRTEMEAGETVGVTAVVENRGDARGESEVELYVDERFVESRFVTLDPGERRNVTFERSFDEPGTYELRTGEVVAGNLTVTEAIAGGGSGSATSTQTPSATPAETATSTPSDGTGDGSSDGSTASPTGTPATTPDSTERPPGTAVEPGTGTPTGTVAPATSDRSNAGTPLAPAGVGDEPVTAVGMAGAAIAIGGGAYLVVKD